MCILKYGTAQLAVCIRHSPSFGVFCRLLSSLLSKAFKIGYLPAYLFATTGKHKVLSLTQSVPGLSTATHRLVLIFLTLTMKFARYLQDTQNPEWEDAYIDYYGLKICIANIRKCQESLELQLLSTMEEGADVETINGTPKAQLTDDDSIRTLASQDDVVLITLKPLTPPVSVPSLIPFSTPRHTHTPRKSTPKRNRLSRIILPHPTSCAHSQPTSLRALLPTLSPVHLTFFSFLDAQLKKIERFYLEKEKESRTQNKKLEIQLRKLEYHRQIFDESRPSDRIVAMSSSLSLSQIGNATKSNNSTTFSHTERLDPEEYRHARKKLKRALFEHYRRLEELNDYRVLNITGFWKALKKYEKVSKVPALHAYMTERVDTSAFSSGASVNKMINDTEELFAARFERGDKKRATARLRCVSQRRNYHSSTVRSGIALGLALPAIVMGVYQSFQPERRAAIPSWGVLLFIYSIMSVPVLLGLLVGLNLLVWSNARINYVFIFGLDVRTRLDHRGYFEIPAILLATLAYAFWLSFSGIATPTLWPLVWLGFTFVFILNPLHMISKSSRWWLVKNVSRLFMSGFHQVEFTDFWIGDQLCSLTFTLSNIYFIFCAYADDFRPIVWQRCGPETGAGWAVQFTLAIIPLLLRLVQSLRRYVDSNSTIHLINGGKYGFGIVQYFFYFLWQHHGVDSRGWSFVLWCLLASIYATYACTWDFLIDWSILKPCSRYPLLRQELVYGDIPNYYFALVSNVVIRFIWVMHIPRRGPSHTLRMFICGILEMMRRWQWNFYRLENEHLGNMDQYRVTREVPLPYSFDNTVDEDKDDVSRPKSWLGRKSVLEHDMPSTSSYIPR